MNYKLSLIVLLLIVSLTLTGMAQQPQQKAALEDPPWIKQIAPPRIVYSAPGMGQIKARKDLTYKRAADDELKMDVYVPPTFRAARAAPPSSSFTAGASRRTCSPGRKSGASLSLTANWPPLRGSSASSSTTASIATTV